MRHPGVWLTLAVAGAAIWYFAQRFELDGLDGLAMSRRDGLAKLRPGDSAVPLGQKGTTVRLATFNIRTLGAKKVRDTQTVEILSRILRQYDLIAIQEIRSRNDDVLPRLIDKLNEPGRSYGYVISRRLGATTYREQYAFVFDQATMEVDHRAVYLVDDPDGLFHRPPFVAWFRARGPATEDAFTFSAVNLHVDPDRVAEEVSLVDDVLRIVRDDGRDEDDVIVLGDFNTDDAKMAGLADLSSPVWAVAGEPTNTRGTNQFDNVLFSGRATSEYTGRSGIHDFLREFNLTMQEALQVSDHLPVWAEFSIYEGGR